MVPTFLGIDLGGTKIQALVVGADGAVLGRARCDTKADLGYDGVLDRVHATASEAASDAGIAIAELSGVGIGVPGPVDTARGRILLAPNLGWGERAIGDDLGARVGLPVAVGNDVNVGALGETRLGCARGAASVCAAFVGTGLGGALVLDGRIVGGAHGFAGEIGHLAAPFGEALCGCGRRGCLETTASRTGLARLVTEAVARGEPALLRDPARGRLRSSELRDAWRAGCPATRAALSVCAHALAWGLAAVGTIVDPQVFVLGGGLAESFGEAFLAEVRAALPEFSLLYRSSPADVRLAALGDDAVALGAACLAIDSPRVRAFVAQAGAS